MAVITIDQTPFEVDQQKNLLETAISLGLDVPYFCWHPALGSVGSCRLCAVQQMSDENDTVGRTVMACMTPVKDQMRFSIVHPTAKEFRAAVVEWLMTNHPHDCPICDEGGECHLQDMTVLTGHNYRRYRFQKRTFNNQNLGPFINHEMNRCITCYRCVRYYRDVSGGTDLSAFKSSGKVYFGRFAEGSLESEFSGNLVEMCPTGVFTDKPYHQRYVRKWDLSTSPSICQLCSVGCNISLGERGGILRRVQNRYHNDVNGFFICDRGRFGHDYVNSDRRITRSAIRRNQTLEEVSTEEAMKHVARLLAEGKNIIGIGSPSASLEANYLLKRLVSADNFYDGLPAHQANAVNVAVDVLRERAVAPASLKHVREADAVLIIGEDITNTAPIAALCIRQASMAYKQRMSQVSLDIAPWNDAAVRDFARGDLLPVYNINSLPASLDSMCHQNLLTHPMRMPSILSALCDALENNKMESSLSESENAWVSAVKDGLLAAKNPVIIAGASLGEPQLIQFAKDIARILDAKNGQTRLSLILPDANSVGFALLKPKRLSNIIESTKKGAIDVAIVLEHDVQWRFGSRSFNTLCQGIKNLVVIDSLKHETANAAAVIVPTLSFLETAGALISNEGRLQRYYGASSGDDSLKASYHILASLMGADAENKFQTIDDVAEFLPQALGIAEDSFARLFDAEFRVLGQKIPRQTSEASGRTAILAHISVHEPKPPSDLDSPLAFSMEGARKKIPLPLISTSWTPKWNSLQASFKNILSPEGKVPDAFGGVRLFSKIESVPPKVHAPLQVKEPNSVPYLYVVPKHNIFASFSQANFSSALATRMPEVEAEMSTSDAKKLGFSAFAPIVLETDHGRFSLLAKTKDDIPEGVLLLPFGLVDASLFFSACLCRVVSKEQV